MGVGEGGWCLVYYAAWWVRVGVVSCGVRWYDGDDRVIVRRCEVALSMFGSMRMGEKRTGGFGAGAPPLKAGVKCRRHALRAFYLWRFLL